MNTLIAWLNSLIVGALVMVSVDSAAWGLAVTIGTWTFGMFLAEIVNNTRKPGQR